MAERLDLILVGAGLSSALLAYRLRQVQPSLKILVLESKADFDRNKTWSFHGNDLSEHTKSWVLPLVSTSWRGYSVVFPKYQRILNGDSYNSIRARDFFKHFELLGVTRFNSAVTNMTGDSVTLSNGETILANTVIDATGLGEKNSPISGYQKFLGLTLKLKNPHGLNQPILMDASCKQKDGYRFIYALPWDSNSLLVEDTRYSGNPFIDHEAFRMEIRAWVSARGWEILSEDEEEAAALPIPLKALPCGSQAIPPKLGTAGGYFHALTGYSLPQAAEIAERISHLPELETNQIGKSLAAFDKARSKNHRYNLFLNRLMFCAAEPEGRIRIFERFYRFSENLISRLYAEKLSLKDRMRILSGRPPVSVRKALKVVLSKAVSPPC